MTLTIAKDTFPSLQHLVVLREVGSRGSTNAAARALFRSQPAVTQAIAAMEKRYRIGLFMRTSAGMVATVAGTLVVNRVARALEHLSEGSSVLLAGKARSGLMRLRAIGGAQLLAVAAVVEGGGFGAAARLTGLSRASLHRSCRALEKKLGVPLFETTSYGLEPTREAEGLARRVRLAAAELRQAHTEVENLSGTSHARVVVGAMPLARTSLVPKAILRFAARHPRHTVTVLDGPYETLLSALRHGSADILVGALREPLPASDVVQEHLFDDPLAIVVRAGHPLQGQQSLDSISLSNFPWIAPRVGTPLRQHFERIFEHLPLPTGIVECNSLSAARALLRSSDHAMLLSAHQVGPDLATGALALLPHPQGNVWRRIGITTRRDWHPTSVQAEFVELLRTSADEAAANDPTIVRGWPGPMKQ